MPPNTQQAAVQICQPGFDVRSCPDWAYLFNSNWPSLAITLDEQITVTGGSYTLNHSFGYPPLTLVWDNSSTGYGRMGGGGSAPQITASSIFLFTNGSFTVRCYNVDISKEAAYPLPQSAQAKLPYNNQFGIKQAKAGRYVTSNNLNDFIIHSRSQSPAVLNVATENGQYYKPTGGPTGGPAIVYPLQTSFIPWVVGFLELGAGQYKQLTPNALSYKASSNSLIMKTQNALYNGGSLVVLRDPLFYPNTVSVVY